MKQLEQIETKLEQAFKDVPNIPKSGKKTLVEVMPWLALIFGVIQVFVAYGLYKTFERADDLVNQVNTLAGYYTAAKVDTFTFSAFDKLTIYVGIAVLLVTGIIGILAYKPLLARERRGWDLLFLAAVINVAYAVVAIFMPEHGIGDFVMSLIGSAIGFYLLFQIRDAYGKKAIAPKAPKAPVA